LSVPNDDDSDSFSSRALRRARIDLIFKDYEVTGTENALKPTVALFATAV